MAKPVRTFSFEASELDDGGALMREEPAPVQDMSYGLDDFKRGDFARRAGGFGGGRVVSITFASSSEWDGEADVMVTGQTAAGEVTENLTIPDGGGRVYTRNAFIFPPGIVIVFPEQPVGTTFDVGCADVFAPPGETFTDVRAAEAGLVAVRYADDTEDEIKLERGERLGVEVVAVLRDTKVGVTLYIGSPLHRVDDSEGGPLASG